MEMLVNVKACQSFESINQIEEGRKRGIAVSSSWGKPKGKDYSAPLNGLPAGNCNNTMTFEVFSLSKYLEDPIEPPLCI